MRDFALIVHFIGLAMGIGTSLAFMTLGIASRKMEPKVGQSFMLNAFTLSKIGNTGIILLIISGFYLMTPYLSAFSQLIYFHVKLTLVAILAILIVIINVLQKKAKKAEEPGPILMRIGKIGKIALPVAITIVILAVLTFH